MIETYLSFCRERHKIWLKRQAGDPGPWTDDPILATRKFTNVFRILDPGTQFVVQELLPDANPPGRADALLPVSPHQPTKGVESVP